MPEKYPGCLDDSNEPLVITPDTVTGAQLLLYRMCNNGRDPDCDAEVELVVSAANRELTQRGILGEATSATLDHVLSVLNSQD